MSMNIKDIKEIAGLMDSCRLSRLELKDGNFSLVLEAEKQPQSVVVQSTSHDCAPVVILDEAAADDGLYCQKAPLVGTLYLAPAEDAPAYVSVGSTVKKGDIICIIEAMKFLNEIAAEVDGVIEEICIENEHLVEFGQPIFKIREL